MSEGLRNPLPPQVWVKATCKVLGICSERVQVVRTDVVTGLDYVAEIRIDGRPLIQALREDFVRDGSGKSVFDFGSSILKEVRASADEQS